MGTCYSKKASGGNRSYTTVPMASTKLDEASRLARPTPYTRTPNANIDYSAKKSIPLSTKYSSFSAVDQGDIKNIKNTYQSNIPRFSSSLPIPTSVEQKISTLNENEIANNNAVMNARSVSSTTVTTPSNKLIKAECQIKPKSIGSKSCPDKIINNVVEERNLKTPGKVSGLPRHSVAKTSQSIPQINSEIVATPKYQHMRSKANSCEPSPLPKSPSQRKFDSKDSLSDFDSGLGNSLTDKQKPEDSDTVKDLEHLELLDSPVSGNQVSKSSSVPKIAVKAPSYKRELNGKWSFDEKHFSSDPEYTPKSSAASSPREKHSFKINASDNIFSTYASYKGLLSYQKKSFKAFDSSSISRDASLEKQSSPATLSCIPKIRKMPNQPVPNRNSLFYVQAESETQTLKSSDKKEKSQTSSKQSSVDSDEKSDSTENGVLSPPSEVENRDFLIDDEISDQPDLTLCCDPNSEESDLQSLQLAVSELHALQMASSSCKKRTDSVSSYSSRKSRNTENRDSLVLGSDLGSSCSSIASDDLMLDFEKTYDNFPEGTINEGPASPMRKIEPEDKVTPLRNDKKVEFEEKSRKRLQRRSSNSVVGSLDKSEWRQRTVSLPLRPPRQMTISEADDGCLKLDSSSYRLLCQDLNGVKTLLLRLKSVIQEAETINPFDQSNPKNIFFQSLVSNDFPSSFMSGDLETEEKRDYTKVTQENADLRRQIVLLQQQLEEKDHTIHLLQQQMTKYLNHPCNYLGNSRSVNAATQTERCRSMTSSLSSSSSSTAGDSIETLVSFRITKLPGRF